MMDDDFEDLFQDYKKASKHAKDSTESTQYKTQFEDVTQLSNQYGSLGDVFKTSEKQSRDYGEGGPSDKKFGDVALLLRRTYHWDFNTGESWTMALEIQSPVLRNAFKEIVKGFTSVSLEQNPIVIKEPFSELYFCRERIQEAIQRAESDKVRGELELLETFRKTYMKNTITALETSRSEGLIEAADLWSLFPIGETIILQNTEVRGRILVWCVVVRQCFEEPAERSDDPKVWNVHVEFTSFNGKHFVPVGRTFHIGGYVGAQAIQSLPAYPLSLHPHKEDLRQALIKRGRKYADLCMGRSETTIRGGKACHRTYAGPFWHIPSRRNFWEPLKNVSFHSQPDSHHSGRLVVDPSGLLLENPEFRDTIADTPNNEHGFHRTNRGLEVLPLNSIHMPYSDGRNLDDEGLLTLPATLPAYSLSFKEWGLVDAETVQSINWRDDTYDMLQMEAEQKEMVRGIIESHHASSSTFDDFIPGKGRGLVFLLHGPPGCGKTLTAESAAESLHRPLYYISGAELGLVEYDSDSLESKLRLIFGRIARWEAILLFDEAESFVSSRENPDRDGKKNALTSILLRMLEYQSGIVFLTTNRFDDFDKALFSRVHITLKFEQLSPSHCRFIWTKIAEQTDHDLTGKDFDRLSQIPLDGRTIKNILRVASLEMKRRARSGANPDPRMNITDVKAVLRYTVGDPKNSVVSQRVDEFYHGSNVDENSSV